MEPYSIVHAVTPQSQPHPEYMICLGLGEKIDFQQLL